MTIEEHYKTLAPKLTNWLVSTGSPYHEACDIVQNTFLKIWKMRDDLQDNDTAVSGLVFTIARNLRKNLHRDDKHLVFSDEPPEEQRRVTAHYAALRRGEAPEALGVKSTLGRFTDGVL